MLVINHARRLIQNLPAALPREKAQIRVLEIEGRKQRIESAELEKFAAIECARASAAVKARIESADLRVYAMPDPQPALLPPALRKAGLLAQLAGSVKKIWQATANTFSSANPSSSGARKSLSTRISLLSSTTMSCSRLAKAFVRSAAESEIFLERDQPYLREMFTHKLGAAVARAVIDNDDFASGTLLQPRRSPKANIFREDRGRSSWESRCSRRRCWACESAGNGRRGRIRQTRSQSSISERRQEQQHRRKKRERQSFQYAPDARPDVRRINRPPADQDRPSSRA